MSREAVYDRIGGSYLLGRREDPRIAEAIREALGDAGSVLNVGAGAGAYEPRDRRVIAVEPSATMIARRPPGAAPAVRAIAERLPFADDEFDAAMGVLTIHHWTDRRRGLAELQRVARDRIVLFMRDPDACRWWWLYEYFPATERLVAGRETRLEDLAAVLGPLETIPVPVPADCRDGFEAAFWRRPHAYLDPEVRATMPVLALIPELDRRAGVRALRADLETGEWQRRWGHLLQCDELDLGYRVVIARC
ncbi:MAG: class I SAM-dependent methyltransferase [Solirubrobacterales bacterium]|nr:class I SAM-dependent methyltransferase [Solirubrobacterales bacterium]